jgi:hypothetical protein
MWLNALVLAGDIILLASPGGSASAKETASAYTKIDTDRCSHTRGTEVEDYGSWRCKGYAGIGVRLSANDQRMHVSFGPRAATEIAASETFGQFNDFYKGVIEWRLEKQRDGKARPFAAIARWNVQTAADVLGPHAKASGRVLVVTRLGPRAAFVMWVMSTRSPMQTPTISRARSRTKAHAHSNAARTSLSFSAR